MSGTSGPVAVLYVTFHGGHSDGAINTVVALDADGAECPQPVVAPSGLAGLTELRGLCRAANGGLYLCVAHKSKSRLLLFDAGDSGGFDRKLVATVAKNDGGGGPFAALMHPYSVVLLDGSVFVSDQDSGFVSWFTPGAGNHLQPRPASAYLRSFTGSNFPPGSFVACAEPPAGMGWSAVPADEGGLGLTTNGGSHSVRGFAFAGGSLYVADEANDRVAVYDAVTGTFQPHAPASEISIARPVGIAASPDGTLLYIGSSDDDAVYRLALTASGAPERLGKVDTPSGLAVDGNGTLYVGSRKGKHGDSKHRIFRWSGSQFEQFGPDFTDEPECLLAL